MLLLYRIYILTMNIFELNATKLFIQKTQSKCILPFLNWIQCDMKIDWIYGVYTESGNKVSLIYASSKGSLLYIYVIKESGIYRVYEATEFQSYKDFEYYIKTNKYIIISKYEGVQNVYSLEVEKILSIIDYPPDNITSNYLQHTSDIIVEYLDTKNKLDTITDTYYVFRMNMTNSNNNLIKMCQQKEEEKKALNKMISDTKELLKIKSI